LGPKLLSSFSFAAERFEPMLSLASASISCVDSLEMIASLMVVQLCKEEGFEIHTLVPVPDDHIDHAHLATFMAQLLSCEVTEALEKKLFLLTKYGLTREERFDYKKNAIVSDRNVVMVSVYALDVHQRQRIEKNFGDSGANHLRFFSFL
jgi:hypothetical protein